MVASLFKTHMISALFYFFWALQITPVSANTPLYWFDLSRMLQDRSINNWFHVPATGQSVERSMYDHFSGILLIPNQGNIKSKFDLYFQGILTDNLSSEIDGVLEYSYDLVNFETSINIKTSKPILINYDNEKAKIINMTGKGYILTNNSSIEKHNLYNVQKKVLDELSYLYISNIDGLIPTGCWQVYMMSAEGHGGNEGNDKKKETSDNKKSKKTDKKVIICERCQTPYYGISPTAGGFVRNNRNVYLLDESGNLINGDDSTQLSACTFFRCVLDFAKKNAPRTGVSYNPFKSLSHYPPCSFYAELDSGNACQPARNNDFPRVYVAMERWSDGIMRTLTLLESLLRTLTLSESLFRGINIQRRDEPQSGPSQEGISSSVDEGNSAQTVPHDESNNSDDSCNPADHCATQ